jgi:hypothetical protein
MRKMRGWAVVFAEDLLTAEGFGTAAMGLLSSGDGAGFLLGGKSQV